MSHAQYTTDAFVLGSRPTGEANRMVFLYTTDFGLVKALAQGVRLEKSKLRFRLYTGGRVRVTLVRGREVWRLTGAEEGVRPVRLLATPERLALFARISSLVSRLVQGEESDLGLYDELEQLVTFLDAEDSPRLSYAEALFVARILERLGYLPAGLSSEELEVSVERLRGDDVAQGNEQRIVQVINGALATIQL